MKQTRSYALMRSPTMDVPQIPTSSLIPKKPPLPPLIDFPTSPQLILGQEMIHFSHPQHPLSQLDLRDQFCCIGCKEYGAGLRFSCQQCDFQLHDFCALAPPGLKGHPFHTQHQLAFYSKPAKSTCDVCAKPSKGFVFRCGVCSFQMHPCCAMLDSEAHFPCHAPQSHTLRLLPANITSNGDPANIVCGECKRRRAGRVYSCRACDYYLHAVCAKNMVNGFHANGINDLEKPRKLRGWHFASQVVGKIIGGLLEGIAEGLGEGLVQNISKGKGTSTTTRTI